MHYAGAVSTSVIGYIRVSTVEQEDSGLSLEHQRSLIGSWCLQRGWNLLEIHEDTGSAKSLKRPGLATALQRLEAREASGLVVTKLDRLSRSLIDFVNLMAKSQKEGWSLAALDLGVDTSTPAGEMLSNVLVAFAQYERKLIGLRTKDALAVKKSRGERLGRPRVLPEAIRSQLEGLRNQGLAYRAIADLMNSEGVPTAHGGARWHGNTVRQVLNPSPR